MNHIIYYSKEKGKYIYSISNPLQISLPKNNIETLYPLVLYDMQDVTHSILSSYESILIENEYIDLKEIREKHPELVL